jgi:hypothetical protein
VNPPLTAFRRLLDPWGGSKHTSEPSLTRGEVPVCDRRR